MRFWKTIVLIHPVGRFGAVFFVCMHCAKMVEVPIFWSMDGEMLTINLIRSACSSQTPTSRDCCSSCVFLIVPEHWFEAEKSMQSPILWRICLIFSKAFSSNLDQIKGLYNAVATIHSSLGASAVREKSGIYLWKCFNKGNSTEGLISLSF